MSHSIPDAGLEFDGEMLVPRDNLVAYRQIYTLEGWLRRICLAAWMATFGTEWTKALESRLRRTLESRVRHNREKLYLGAESHDDLIWQATYAELVRMLVADSVADEIQSLTGSSSAFLKTKLDDIRDIRNLLAHNRAFSERTRTILSGLLASLEEAVNTFKSHVLYGPIQILDDEDGWLGSRLAQLLEGNDWSRFQAFVARRGEFIEYVSLPVDRHGDWPDAGALLQTFRDHLNGIVAFSLNKTGSEFAVVTPTVLARESHEALCDAFAKNPNVWTSVPFETQQPRFVCSPKIWFYENQPPPITNLF